MLCLGSPTSMRRVVSARPDSGSPRRYAISFCTGSTSWNSSTMSVRIRRRRRSRTSGSSRRRSRVRVIIRSKSTAPCSSSRRSTSSRARSAKSTSTRSAGPSWARLAAMRSSRAVSPTSRPTHCSTSLTLWSWNSVSSPATERLSSARSRASCTASLVSANASPSSSTRTPGLARRRSAHSRRMSPQNPWMVPTRAPSTSCAMSRRPASRSSSRSFSLSLPAAALVNVIAAMSSSPSGLGVRRPSISTPRR